MYSGILRRFGASLVVVSFWGGALTILPISGSAQDATKDAAKQDKPEAKDTDKDKDKKDVKPAPATGPLGPKDDPSQIGKRNINKGTDKFFGWLGGSQEKEMQIGRQLAL